MRGATEGNRIAPFEDDLLGTMPDEDLAEKLHRTPEEVRKRRIRLGVRFREDAPAERRWTIAEELLLGTDTDRAVARKLATFPVLRCHTRVPAPETHPRAQPLQSEAVKAKNSSPTTTRGVLRKGHPPTGGVLWRTWFSTPSRITRSAQIGAIRVWKGGKAAALLAVVGLNRRHLKFTSRRTRV
jgi:hypothetical protein